MLVPLSPRFPVRVAGTTRQPDSLGSVCPCSDGTGRFPDASELQRDMARLGFVVSQIREIEEARQKRLEQETETGPHAMVRQLGRPRLGPPIASSPVSLLTNRAPV
jgi:hypothetical protein